jgi:hypothetical protein
VTFWNTSVPGIYILTEKVGILGIHTKEVMHKEFRKITLVFYIFLIKHFVLNSLNSRDRGLETHGFGGVMMNDTKTKDGDKCKNFSLANIALVVVVLVGVFGIGALIGSIENGRAHERQAVAAYERIDAFVQNSEFFISFDANCESEGTLVIVLYDGTVVRKDMLFVEGMNLFVPEINFTNVPEFYVIIDRDNASAEIGKFWMSNGEPIWWPGEGGF